MEPVIRSLTLKGFRSFGSEQVSFDNPTFLVGQNGAGKSKLADALAFLADAMSAPLSAVIAKRGGVSALAHKIPGAEPVTTLGLAVDLGRLNGKIQSGHYAFEIRFLPDYNFEVVQEQCTVKVGNDTFYFKRGKDEQSSNIEGLYPLLDPQSLGMLSISGYAQFAPVARALAGIGVYSIDPARVREPQTPDSGLGLLFDGRNAASVLREIERRSSEDIVEIGEFLAAMLPHKVQVRSIQQGNKISIEFVQEWDGKTLMFEASSMSDGTLRALGLLAAVYQHPAPSVIVFEEPESTVHPGALGVILDLIHVARHRAQVVVTTHSPELLDAGKWIEDRHLRVVYWQDGASHVAPIGKASREALRENLMGAGELLRSNVLDTPPFAREVTEPSLFEALP
jgi:predicted ATPase